MRQWVGRMRGFTIVGFVAAAVLSLGLGAGVVGCSDDSGSGGSNGTGGEGGNGENGGGNQGGGGDVVNLANIQVSPSNIQFNAAQATGSDQRQVVTIITSAAKNLNVSGIELKYTPVTADEVPPAFRIVQVRGLNAGEVRATFTPEANDLLALDADVGINGNNADYTAIEIELGFLKPPSTVPRSGTLHVYSSADGKAEIVIPVSTTDGVPRIEVNPLEVNFDGVGQDSSDSRIVGINNIGSATLNVDSIEFQGSQYFRLKIGEDEYPTGGVIQLDPPIQVSTVEPYLLGVIFEPLAADPATATVRIFSDDPNEPAEGTLVQINGNLNGPCIALNPKEVLNFGPRILGQPADLPVEIVNCGNAPLEISTIAMEPESSTDFTLDFTEIPGFVENIPPTAEGPVVVGINGKVTLMVRYVPDSENPLDDNGDVIPDLGVISFVNNSFEAEKSIEVRGVGVDVDCPIASIEIAEGEEVIPQTTLHLSGEASFSAAGDIVEYNWTVIQPAGSASVFVPSAKVFNPSFTANVAGVYTFQLQVRDDTNTASCFAAEAQVAVVPDEAIHVELVWTTPNDPDETDEGAAAGSDLDLHFAHPFAGGPDIDGDGKPDGWFDVPFDTFWFNPNPSWENVNPAVDDDPSLDRDDTDGAGPENLNLNEPINGHTYRVGVHYWDDHQYGDSYATVFVYIYSNLVWSAQDVRMKHLDMWEVCSITWQAAAPLVQTATNQFGEYKITSNYKNPIFY